MANYRLAHLCRRGDALYFRMAVPRSLVPRVGKREFKLSLKTSDQTLARQRCRLLSSSLTALLCKVEAMPNLTPEAITDLARRYYAQALTYTAEVALLAPQDPRFDFDAEILGAQNDELALLQRIGRHQYDGSTVAQAQKLLQDSGFKPIATASEQFDAICHGVLRAKAECRRVLVALLRGQMAGTIPTDPLFHDILPGSLPALPGDTATKAETLSAVAEQYTQVKSKSGEWVGKTFNENKRVLEVFCSLVGGDRLISHVTDEDVRQYRDALLHLPPNYTKLGKFAGKSLVEILKLSKQPGTNAGLATKTRKKYLANLRTFFLWAVDEGYLTKAPGLKVKINTKVNAQDARSPFSVDQLQKLFSSPQYVGHRSSTMRGKPGKFIVKDGCYWVPLVGLFTGMRLGEIVQLLATDVREDQGVAFFDVKKGEGEDKHLKTASSRRAVPVHPMLVKLGFMDFVGEQRKGNPDGRVFADIEKGKDGYYSHNFSKWFSRYTKQVGVKTSRTSFHSFRHSFKDALVQGGVEDTKIKALLGHADNSVTSQYGSKFTPGLLAKEVAKVAYAANLDGLCPA